MVSTFRCGCVERRADSEALGGIVRHGVSLLMKACEVRLKGVELN
jgi:hypothetical protein